MGNKICVRTSVVDPVYFGQPSCTRFSDFQLDWKIVMTTIQFNLSAKFPKFCLKSPFWPSKDYFWLAHRNATFLCSWDVEIDDSLPGQLTNFWLIFTF